MAVMNGALDGSLEQLRRYNYEATGELNAISESVGVSTEKMWEGMKGSEPFIQRLGISFSDLSIYTAMLAKSGIKGVTANDVLAATFGTYKGARLQYHDPVRDETHVVEESGDAEGTGHILEINQKADKTKGKSPGRSRDG